MPGDLSPNSFQRYVSRMFSDPKPISFTLLDELDSNKEILLHLQRRLASEPNATFLDQTNSTALARSTAGEAVEAVEERPDAIEAIGEERAEPTEMAGEEHLSGGDPTMRSEVAIAQSLATGELRKVRRRRTKEQRKEFYSRRPNRLPEGLDDESQTPNKRGH